MFKRKIILNPAQLSGNIWWLAFGPLGLFFFLSENGGLGSGEWFPTLQFLWLLRGIQAPYHFFKIPNNGSPIFSCGVTTQIT
jgi:hypothetical protein